ALFEDRLWAFLVDNRPRRGVSIQLAGRPYDLIRSTSNGHILDAVQLPEQEINPTAALSPTTPATVAERWLDFNPILPEGDKRRLRGGVIVVGQQGLWVTSKTDETIKITHVHDGTAFWKQTFLREFESVPGMADLYRQWQGRGATFHYVTRSPWQLYEPLA